MESCVQGLGIPASAKRREPDAVFTTRHMANFHPSIWGDHFLAYSSNPMEADVVTIRRLQELKERVRNKLVGDFDNCSHQLDLIDAIQRLGVGYHFKNEIDTILKKLYDNVCQKGNWKIFDDLYTVSLTFRLLRQQGYPVTADMFKDMKEKMKKTDLRGLLSLYEAAYLRVQGEDILDEALDLTIYQLNSVLPNIKSSLKAQVIHALKQPIHTGLTRLEARAYLTFYEKDESHDKILLEFAKLDFNQLQMLHQKELSDITRWWKDLDFVTKLPYARDRVVECYFWILGVYFEPEYALARRILLEVIVIISVVDDTYDAFGTLEELALFTDAVERWDINAMAQLPAYMQRLYKAFLDVYIMIEEEMAKLGKSYRLPYAKETMKNLVKAYFKEAKWCNMNYVPKFEEYMEVALVTGSYITLSTVSYMGMGDIATETAFKWVMSDPPIVRASSVICRLQDDMVGHKFEQERKHVASAVECYMKQYGVSEKEVNSEFQKRVKNAWKDLNAECLFPTEVPMPLLTRVLNLARVINVLYNGEDGYTNSSRIKGLITSVLIDPVPI